jgi:hypothetical protein
LIFFERRVSLLHEQSEKLSGFAAKGVFNVKKDLGFLQAVYPKAGAASRPSSPPQDPPGTASES